MCDTFVALASSTEDNSIIFGKNSDREANEAQALEYFPAREFKKDTLLNCTYITIPQINKTHSVLISRPFWMWGAEMGANDCGVVIGNEAVWSKMPLQKEGGLTGMDLLRLALERSNSSQNALEIITELLAEYGQGGACGYENRGLFYHNSFLIADDKEAWVLETAGNLWAAKKVKKYYSISNCLTIGATYDIIHPELIKNAQDKGWLKKGQTFNFADCYAEWFYTTFSKSRSRRSRSMNLLKSAGNNLNTAQAIKILRDHGKKDYSPDSHLFLNHICAHSANSLTRHAAQSTGSFVAHLLPSKNTFWVTGTSSPCTSIFKPIRLGPDCLNIGPELRNRYDQNSLWWQHEILHRLILKDFNNRIKVIENDRDKFENLLLEKCEQSTAQEFKSFSNAAFISAQKMESGFVKLIKDMKKPKKEKYFYSTFWEKLNQKAEIFI